jgi:hypothetical protein
VDARRKAVIMGMPMMKMQVPLRVELRRVTKAANGHPGKTHVVVNGTLLCDGLAHDSDVWLKREDHERVGLTAFTGREACIVCYSRLNDVTVEEAKAELAAQEEPVVVAADAGLRPALWVNANEIWPAGNHEVHFILRGSGGWERHKVVHDVETRKHYDPRLFEKLSGLLKPSAA